VSRQFKPRRTFERELRGQPVYQAEMRAKAVLLARLVQLIAQTFRDTGNYSRKVKAIGTRVEVRDIAWHIIEFGAIGQGPKAPVRRAVRAAGLRFVDGRSETPGG
jgi:hypothetical protein